jgi:hypothetical protein
LPVSDLQPADFHPAGPTCPQIKRRPVDSRELNSHSKAPKHRGFERGTNRFAARKKGTSMQQLIASKRP